MKKLLAFLLAMTMLLTLCACGGTAAQTASQDGGHGTGTDPQAASPAASSPAEETAPAEEAPAEPVPLENYYWDEMYALTEQRIERGITTPSLSSPAIGTRLESISTFTYDESGEPTVKSTYVTGDEILTIDTLNDYWLLHNEDGSENTEDFIFEHDEAGQISRIQRKTSDERNLLTFSDFENGRVVKSWQSLNPAKTGRDDVVLANMFSYDKDGRLLSEETCEYLTSGLLGIELYDEPARDLREYDENGCLIHWLHEDATASFITAPHEKTDIRYEYDATCELIRMTVIRNDEVPETLEIERDEEGRALSSVLTASDGSVTTRSYGYDDQGRLISEDVSGENGTISFTLAYNEDGYPASMTKTVNGRASKPTKYVYEQKENDIMVSAEFTFDEADIFERGGDESILEPRTDENGNIYKDYRYEVAVVGTKILFRRIIISNDYEPIYVPVKTEPGEFEPVSSIGDFYPELRESYGGYKVPTSDGTERLVSVRMRSNESYALDVVASIVYDSAGNAAGLISRFDNGILSSNVDYEFDEQGRVTRSQIRDWHYEFTFRYAEDGRSYTSVEKDLTGTYQKERTFSLDERRVPAMLRSSADDPDTIDVYSEEGLLLKAPMSSNPDEVYFAYEYSFERAKDGSLKRIRADKYYIGDKRYTKTILEFDDHGYPLVYIQPGSYGAEDLTFEYGYASVG